MRFLALVVIVGGSVLLAEPSLNLVNCTGDRGTKIEVQVDVLESHPPQSQITITEFGGTKIGFSAFTKYVTIETNPSIDQWTWRSRDGFRSVTVESQDNRVGTGHYSVGKMLPENLKCSLK